MNGIIVSDLELSISKIKTNVNDLKQNIEDINQKFNSLTQNIKGNDLNFLTSKAVLEIDQFKNVMLKANAYKAVLTGVLKSYINQNEELINSINNIASKK